MEGLSKGRGHMLNKRQGGFFLLSTLILLLIVTFYVLSLVQSYYHLYSFYEQMTVYYERETRIVLADKGER